MKQCAAATGRFIRRIGERMTLVLAGLGTVACATILYCFLPLQPLWASELHETIGGFSPDGALFLTAALPQGDVPGVRGPIRLRNALSGGPVASFLTPEEAIPRTAVSDDLRFWAGILEPSEVGLLDLATCRFRKIAAQGVDRDYDVHFEHGSKWLRVRAAHARLPDRNFLYSLPDGALFGPADQIRDVRFSPFGRYFAFWKGDGMHLWDDQRGREVGRYLNSDVPVIFDPVQRRLATGGAEQDGRACRLALWDLGSHEKVAKLAVQQDPNICYVDGAFSANGRWLVTWPASRDAGTKVEVWDSATGKRVAYREMRAEYRRGFLAPETNCLILIECGYAIRGGFAVSALAMPSAELVWRHEFSPGSLHHSGGQNPDIGPQDIRLSRDGTRLATFILPHGAWEVLEMDSGKTRHVCGFSETSWGIRAVGRSVSRDGRCLVSQAEFTTAGWRSPWVEWLLMRWRGKESYRTVTKVHDSKTGEELLQITLAGEGKSYIAPDGGLLLTESLSEGGDGRLRCLRAWPVPARRPWGWIVGASLLFGVLLGGGHAAWRMAFRKQTGAVGNAGNCGVGQTIPGEGSGGVEEAAT